MAPIASIIARQQMCGDSAGDLLHPRAPALVRNHAKDNIRAMREKQRQLQGKHIMESQAKQRPVELFKLQQFADVKSRLHDAKGLPRASAKAGDEMGLAEFEAEVAQMIRKHGVQKQQSFVKDADGCPAYIRKMKEDSIAEQERAQAEHAKPRAPPGHRILPAEEVQETLAALKKKRVEIEAEFRRLPFTIETDSQKRRQKAVMAKIEESDAAIALFSRPTVIVQL